MMRAPGMAPAHARGEQIARRILRLFTWVMVGLFVGTVIGLAVGPL